VIALYFTSHNYKHLIIFGTYLTGYCRVVYKNILHSYKAIFGIELHCINGKFYFTEKIMDVINTIKLFLKSRILSFS